MTVRERTPLRRRLPALPAWLGQLGRSGVPEALTAFLFYVYNEMFPPATAARSPLDVAADFLICFFAGVTGRWPRVGTIGVAACLLWMAVSGSEYISTALFTLFIPLVSNGAHGRTILRDLSAIAYSALAITKTLPSNNNLSDAIQTVIIWLAFVGLGWAAGRTVHRLRREGQRQAQLREESLRDQRRGIARDLHDTVSYATTTMIMRAEQIKLRTTDDPRLVEDLDFIIATGRRSVRDLRSMMEALRRNDPGFELEDDAPWRVVSVEEVLRERRAELAAHGLYLQVSSEADLDSLPNSVRETLAKLVVEATSNMVKHAGHGPCRLIIEVHDDVVEAVFTNPTRRERSGQGQGEGLGLVGASERIEALGGELEATAASGTWILRAQLPIGQ